jgi:hypothetical protein
MSKIGKPLIEGYIENGKLPSIDGAALGQTKLLMHFEGADGQTTLTDQTGKDVTNVGTLDSYTKLLISGDGVDGSTSLVDDTGKSITNTAAYSLTKLMLHLDNNVTDSAAGKTVTNNNVTFSNTAGQFKWGYSGVFDGSTAYLTVPDSADWAFGTDDLTIDCWVYVDTSSSMSILDQRFDGSHLWSLYKTSDNNLACQCEDSGLFSVVTTNEPVTASAWHHIAVVRKGTTSADWLLFVDGVSCPTSITGDPSKSFSDFAATLYIGRIEGVAGSYFFNGYMDELRIVKGFARWTADFTPPAYPYGQVVNTTIQKKIGVGAAWFDGNGSNLTLADHADWDFSTGDFTVDMWIMFNTANANYQFIFEQETDSNHRHQFYYLNNTITFTSFDNPTDTVLVTGSWTPTVGVWYHLALVRYGNIWTIYVNGASVATNTQAFTLIDYTQPFTIGSYGANLSNLFSGWIDEFRVSKGIARWTANFDTALPAYPYGQVAISTTQKQLGVSSAYFDGVESYLTLPDSDDWYFGTGAFTIDFWIKFKVVGDCYLVSQGENSGKLWLVAYSPNILAINNYNLGDTVSITAPFTPTAGTWYHVAAVRVSSANASSAWRVFVNGVAQTLTLFAGAWSGSMDDYAGTLNIGARIWATTNYLNGWIDELRISKGIARWTSDFTPPIVAYDDIATDLSDRLRVLLNDSVNEGQTFSTTIASTYSLVYTATYACIGGVLAPNGDIHFIPCSGSVGQKISSAGVVSTYSLIYTNVNGAYYGGLLDSNGNIHFCPTVAPVGQKVSPSGVVSTYSLVYTTSSAYIGGVLATNGDVHFVPYSAAVGQKVSSAGTVSTYSLIYTTSSGAYESGVLALNGDIHFVPFSAPIGQKINSAGVVSTYSLIYTTTLAYAGGVLASNGDIHFVPLQAAVGQKISSAGVISTYALAYTTTSAYYGGVLAPNGDIHFIPATAPVGQKVSASGIVSTYSLAYTTAWAWGGGVMAPNGDIHLVPQSAIVGQKISTLSEKPLSLGICCSPFFNKF